MSKKRSINIEVVAREGEGAESLIRRFLKKMKKKGISEELKEHMYFEKPSLKKHRKAIQRKRINEKIKKEQQKEE